MKKYNKYFSPCKTCRKKPSVFLVDDALQLECACGEACWGLNIQEVIDQWDEINQVPYDEEDDFDVRSIVGKRYNNDG